MGLMAWVYYYDGNHFHFRELQGTAGYDSTNPEDWGLAKDCEINLVIQQCQFIQAWVDGNEIRKW